MYMNFKSATSYWNTSLNWYNENPLAEKAVKTMAYCILFLVSLTGNTLIIWAIYRDQRLRTNTNILVANMAVSDLVFPLFLIPERIVEITFDGRWFITGAFGLGICKLLKFLMHICWAVSIYVCIFIANDRYYAVARPFKGGFSRSRLKYIIPGIWILAAIVCIPYVETYTLFTTPFPSYIATYCTQQWSFFGMSYPLVKDFLLFFGFAITSGIPFPVTAILYLFIIYKLRQHKVPGQSIDSVRMRRQQQNKKVLKMSVAIVGLTFITWTLFFCYTFLWYGGKLNHLSPSVGEKLDFASKFIIEMTSCYNFFIYLGFNEVYRANFKAIFWKCFLVFRQRNTASVAAGERKQGSRSEGINNVSFTRGKNNVEAVEMKNLSRSLEY